MKPLVPEISTGMVYVFSEVSPALIQEFAWRNWTQSLKYQSSKQQSDFSWED
jgi:hypothetical protein